MSGTVCCYSGCKKSYSTHKDTVSFFKFPDDPKRRKKWMQSCGNTELQNLTDRQLRGKRICSDHFQAKSFLNPESKTALNDSAVPLIAKISNVKVAEPVKKKLKTVEMKPKVVAEPKEVSKNKDSELVLPSPSKRPKLATISEGTVTLEKSPSKSTPTRPSASKSNVDKAQVETKSVPVNKSPVRVNKRNLKTVESKPKDVQPDPVEPLKNKDTEIELPTSPPKQPKLTLCTEAVVNQEKSPPPKIIATKSTVSKSSVDDTQPETKILAVNKSPQKVKKKVVKIIENKTKVVEVDPKEVSKNKEVEIGLASPTKPPKLALCTEGTGNQEKSPPKIIATKSSVPKSSVDSPKPESKSVPVNKVPIKVKKKLKTGKSKPKVVTVVEPKELPKEIILSTSLKGPKLTLCAPSTVTVEGKPSVDDGSDTESYDEYMYYDRDFEEFEEEGDIKSDREFERFYGSLKKFLHLSGKWTMGGVQWDPQGKRKVIVISEPEIPPSGRPLVKRCLQFFEDKAVRVFLDGMDMTDVFGMTCYAEKEDVAALICRVAESTSCCGVPEMVQDDLVNFPETKKRNTSYFDVNCPGVIPNDAYDPTCTACKGLQTSVLECREREKRRLLERRIRSQAKEFQHPFGKALYTLFNDLVDETDPSKPRKKRTKETFFRKFLHDTINKMNGDTTKTERVYIEKPISVDSVSASFQDIVSKLGFNMPNAKKGQGKPGGGSLPLPRPSSSVPNRSSRLSNQGNVRKHPLQMESILPFSLGSSFTLDDGQEYELIGEVEPATSADFMDLKPNTSQPYEIIELDGEMIARINSSKNQVVMLPEAAAHSNMVTRIDANDPNLSQILKAINTSHGFKV